MWPPTLHDAVCIAVFLAINSASFLMGYFLIATDDGICPSKFVLIYGNVQAFVGYVGGLYISKMLNYPPQDTRPCAHEEFETYD